MAGEGLAEGLGEYDSIPIWYWLPAGRHTRPEGSRGPIAGTGATVVGAFAAALVGLLWEEGVDRVARGMVWRGAWWGPEAHGAVVAAGDQQGQRRRGWWRG